MGKIIRPTYPLEFSIGLLLLVFALSMFLSGQLFEVPRKEDVEQGMNVYFGMFLISTAVIIMFLVLWEEFLFPVKVNPEGKTVIFRNHRNKLKTQLLIYCAIPAIFVFVYLNYEVKHVRFFIWAAIAMILPIAGKLISGLKNYNDFLKLTDDVIQYKNNEKEGSFPVKDIQHISLIKDDRKVLHKVELSLDNNNQVIIDLDEMELEPFLVSIDKFITAHYKNLLRKN